MQKLYTAVPRKIQPFCIIGVSYFEHNGKNPFMKQLTPIFLLIFCWTGTLFANPGPEDLLSDAKENLKAGLDSVTAPPFTGKIRVDSIEYEILDAFDDAKANSRGEKAAYKLLNGLHIKTRKNVVEKNLLFKTGDSVSYNLLVETERILRGRIYISDAKITTRQENGKNIIHVRTSDHWTLTVPVGLNNASGDEWEWFIGILENNFLGLGQTLGFYYQHTIDRDLWFGEYGSSHFIWPHHTLNFRLGRSTDGDFINGTFRHDFLSRERNQFAYVLAGSRTSYNTWLYHNVDEEIPMVLFDSSLASTMEDNAKVTYGSMIADTIDEGSYGMIGFKQVDVDTVSARISRSFGNGIKTYLRAGYDYESRVHKGQAHFRLFQKNNQTMILDPELYSAYHGQKDSRIHLGLSWDYFRYLKVKNYHRIKWTEDVNLGWQFMNLAARNFKSLGASDDSWKFFHKLYGSYAFNKKNIISASTSADYYYLDSLYDAYFKASGEYQFKPTPKHSTVLRGFYDFYHNAPRTKQLYLGGTDGMNSIPYYYLTGKNRVFLQAEQRWFPDLEFGTVVPVFTAYINGGNVFQDVDDYEFEELMWIAGLGARFGMSKSPKGVINIVNIGWPLNGPLENGIKGLRFSVLANVSL